MKPLDGKMIVITGAGGGLGSAYARHAAANGAKVLVNDIDAAAARATVEAIRAEGGDAVARAGDISDWDFASSLAQACVEAFGDITGFVSNAGILRPDRVDAIRQGDVRRSLDINVVGTIAGATAAIRHMQQSGKGGSIINVASGSQAGDIALSVYGASKAAIAALTYSWAMELRGSGIRVNAISPLAETGMAAQNKHLMSVQAAGRDVHYASLPDPEVSAPLVSYLLSDAAAEINGQVVRIAGRQLSYVTHPLIGDPLLVDDWDYARIAAAFTGTLKDAQHKLGLAYVRAPH
jgi:NAD(P)-dependent dehydrogenase (short-subunit alcohol dehydrogenase family)